MMGISTLMGLYWLTLAHLQPSLVIILLKSLQPIINQDGLTILKISYHNLQKLMNLKTIKQSQPRTQEIKILGRKTDNYGKTLYQICWISEGKKITWEPIINLKNFYTQITEYQRNYQERVVNWQTGCLKTPGIGQEEEIKMIEQSIEKEANQNRQKKIIQINSQIEQEQGQKAEFKNNVQQEDIETADKQNIVQKQGTSEQKKRKKPISNEEMDQNIEIARLLIKHSPNINKKRKEIRIPKFLRKNHQMSCQEPKIESIQEIFSVDKVWYAQVVTEGQIVIKVLRDYLRIEYPLLLLAYYEKVYESKLKDFSTIL